MAFQRHTRSSTSSSSLSVASPASLSSSSLSLVASARSADSQPATTTTTISSVSSEQRAISAVLSETKETAGSFSSLPSLKRKALIQRLQEEEEQRTMDYLEYLYPLPQRPPRYSQVKSSRQITFPIYERTEDSVLPGYTPAIYQTTLALRKCEWLSPYEASPARGWKNVFMELNSTQLNFYSLDNIPVVAKVKKSKTKKHYEFTPLEHDIILTAINRSPKEFLTPSRLIKSYSLQHAKFGLPIDYKKRNSCLRLRCETEQFLVQFATLDDMIKWANYLSIGINVALDLEAREMPNDRIVPRRRRNRRHRHRAFSDTELIRRELAEPRPPRRASFTGETSGFKNKISMIFGRKRSSTVDIEQIKKELMENTSSSTSSLQIPSFTITVPPATPSATTHATTHPGVSENRTRPRHDSVMSADISTIREVDEDGSEEEDEEEGEDIPDNEIHSYRELHDSDDDDDSSVQELHDSFEHFTLTGTIHYQYNSDTEKWRPEPKKYSRRKFLKDSLRCIKLLSNDDSWVGKRVVRYSKPPRYQTANKLVGKQPINKFVEEFTVGLQGLVPTCM